MHVLSLFAPCVAPPAARSRTLQWDTDPSVLQLQADSELGYFLPPFCCSFLLNDFPPLAHSFSLCHPQCSLQCLSIFSRLAFYLPSFVCPLLLSFSFFFKFVGFKCFQLVTFQLFARGCAWHWLIYPNQYRCRELFLFHSKGHDWDFVSYLNEHSTFTNPEAKPSRLKCNQKSLFTDIFINALIFNMEALIPVCCDCRL